MVAFFVGGEGAVLYVVAIVLDGGSDLGGGVGILADKLGCGGEGEVDEVVEDKNLAVAIGTGADADGGDGELCGDGGGDFTGNAFEDDCAGSGISEGLGVGLELEDGFSGAGLDAVSAHAVKALRGEAEMGDDGDFGLGEGADEIDARAFDFDGFGAGFFDEANGVGEAIGYCAVIAAEGHVGDEQGAADGAADGAGVMEHLVDGDGEGVFKAHHHHGQRIAHQHHVDARLVDKARGCIVIGGERGDGLALALHLGQRGHGDFYDGGVRRCGITAAGEVRQAHSYLQCRSVNSGCDPNQSEYTPVGGAGCNGGALFFHLLEAVMCFNPFRKIVYELPHLKYAFGSTVST